MRELLFWHLVIMGAMLTLCGCATPREVITKDNLHKLKVLRTRNEVDYVGIWFLKFTGIYGTAFSPDSRLVAFGFGYGTGEIEEIKLVDADTLNLIKVIKTPNNLDIAFSGDGTILVGGQNSLELWDIKKTKRVQVIDHPSIKEDGIWDLVSSPTEPILAATAKKSLILWDINTGAKIKELNGFYNALVLSHDGTMLATAKENKIYLLSTADWSELRILTGHAKPVCSIAFSPDDKILASSEYNTIRDHRSGTTKLAIKLWDVETGRLIGEMKGHDPTIRDLHFSAKGDLLVGYEEHQLGSYGEDSIVFFDVAERKKILSISTNKWIYGLVLRPDGRAIVVHRSGELALYGVPE